MVTLKRSFFRFSLYQLFLGVLVVCLAAAAAAAARDGFRSGCVISLISCGLLFLVHLRNCVRLGMRWYEIVGDAICNPLTFIAGGILGVVLNVLSLNCFGIALELQHSFHAVGVLLVGVGVFVPGIYHWSHLIELI